MISEEIFEFGPYIEVAGKFHPMYWQKQGARFIVILC